MGANRILLNVIETLQSEYSTYKIDFLENPGYFAFENNSILIIISNEEYENKKKKIELKYYYSKSRDLSENSLLNFRSELSSFLNVLKDFESEEFFEESRDIKYYEENLCSEDLRVACVTISYDITRLLDVNYYEGEKDLMKNLITKFEK